MTPALSSPNFPSKTAPERRADFLIHAISVVGLAIASVFLIGLAYGADDFRLLAATAIYALAAMASILVSFAYHLLPRHEWRARLRRWDHAAIYIVIAGAYSPLLVKAGSESASWILAIIWALAGAALASVVWGLGLLL